MALPISLGECLDLANRGIKLYNKIKHDVPDLVAEVADRIESLELYLRRLRTFLQDDNMLVKLRPTEKADLERILGKTRTDIAKVVDILEKWKNNVGPGGFQFKFKFMAQAWFALGSKPEELEDLGRKLDRRQGSIRDWQALLLLWGQAHLLSAQKPSSSLPTDKGPKTDYNLMFIDANNEGRSVMAEAYTKLFREWTVRTGGRWPINLVHSAGLFVKARSHLETLQQRLGMALIEGNKPPFKAAVSALFDKLPYTYQYKHDIRNKVSAKKSRGLAANLFATYDFILVFNRHNMASLDIIRDALARQQGQAAPSGKGKLVLLGEFGTTGRKEIAYPRRNEDGSESFENWAKTNDNIQTSLKNFLKKEVAWSQPARGKAQS